MRQSVLAVKGEMAMNLVHMKTKKKTVGIVLAGLAVVAVVAALFITSRG